MFERAQHRRIGALLARLDAALLERHACWFGGGTAISLRHGEYRESRDIDFMVCRIDGYRELRSRVVGAGLQSLFAEPVDVVRDPRMDQYGIRSAVAIDGVPIKFEIVLEGRVEFETPGPDDDVCGVRTMSLNDLICSKLLANADRWADSAAAFRDVIDLAMMLPNGRVSVPIQI